jgi:hypothetical protein
MIFCFVRETKQLTLEELDRKILSPAPHLKHSNTNKTNRGLLCPHFRLPQLRNQSLAPILLQAPHHAQTDPQARASGYLNQPHRTGACRLDASWRRRRV